MTRSDFERLVLLAKSAVVKLDTIGHLLKRIQEAPKADAVTNETSPKHSNQRPSTLISPISNPEKEDTAANHAYQHKTRPFERFNSRVHLATFFAAAGAFGAATHYACTASKQFELAQRDSIHNQRAYVTLKTLEIAPVPFSPEKDAWTMVPIFANTGNTPTQNLYWSFFPMQAPGTPSFKPIDIMSIGTYFYQTSIGPHQERRTTPPVRIVDPDGIRNGMSVAYIQGILIYQDVVSEQSHMTRYCYTIIGFPPATGRGFSYMDCATNGRPNCSDQECDDYDKLPSVFERLKTKR